MVKEDSLVTVARQTVNELAGMSEEIRHFLEEHSHLAKASRSQLSELGRRLDRQSAYLAGELDSSSFADSLGPFLKIVLGTLLYGSQLLGSLNDGADLADRMTTAEASIAVALAEPDDIDSPVEAPSNVVVAIGAETTSSVPVAWTASGGPPQRALRQDWRLS